MKVTSFNINNYKSIGSKDNFLSVDPKVTALIGKNESGKSNILEAIGKLSFNRPLSPNYLSNKNRGASGEVSIIVHLEYYQSELNQFEVSQANTSLSFIDNTTIKIEGGLSELVKDDELLMEAINDVLELNIRSVWGNESKRIKSVQDYMNGLKVITSHVYINHSAKLGHLKSWITNAYKSKEDLIDKIEIIDNCLAKHYSLLPSMYYREQYPQLEASYKYDDIKDIFKDTNHIFYRFLIAAGITEHEIVDAFEDPIDGNRKTVRNRIVRKIKNNIEAEFNEFYNQEKIEFQIEFESRVFKIYILTDDKAMNLSERSNGLRWYISIFVDVLSREHKNSSLVYLLDEPGVYLHVNAQKQLLELFSRLAERENQVIYTTHSPYMIDSKDITNVRAIEKVEEGDTKIFKSAYNQNLSNDSKMETLSPLVQAIGADLKFNIGPSSKNNLITEGITDYMYMNAMINYLGIDSAPNIIPSAGVSNINRIVSILFGWGCEFKILLDYDKAGYKEYDVLVNKLDETLEDKILFVCCNEEVVKEKMVSNPQTIESLISEDDSKQLSTPYDGSSSSKKLAAKEFHDKVVNKEIELMDETVYNFKTLFEALNIQDYNLTTVRN
ncbi:AAA family ATPase [Virgibacillus byunsanensis]|uniref:AAA family ATPase n=1 Tax=Virgibacillus byunsanensis TaxID=570945 RepID=A0ABW3LMR1_9BACI